MKSLEGSGRSVCKTTFCSHLPRTELESRRAVPQVVRGVPREAVDTLEANDWQIKAPEYNYRICKNFVPAMSGQFEVWDKDPINTANYKKHKLQDDGVSNGILSSFRVEY
jgi:hypothetical protein